MYPFLSSSSRNCCRMSVSFWFNGYTLQLIVAGAPSLNAMFMSSSLTGRNRSAFFLSKISLYLLYMSGSLTSVFPEALLCASCAHCCDFVTFRMKMACPIFSLPFSHIALHCKARTSFCACRKLRVSICTFPPRLLVCQLIAGLNASRNGYPRMKCSLPMEVR